MFKFKSPTTKSSLIPQKGSTPQKVKISRKGSIHRSHFNDHTTQTNVFGKNCSKRFSNNKLYTLGNINIEEKLVEFKLLTSRKGYYGILELFDDEENRLLRINFKLAVIEFHEFGDQLYFMQKVYKNLFATEANINVKIRLTKYFLIIAYQINGSPFLYKFIPSSWWEGINLIKKSENINLRIHGHFIPITPIVVHSLTNYDNHKVSKTFFQKKMNSLEMIFKATQNGSTKILRGSYIHRISIRE
uniref:Galectin n=1 Tax=Meloidogyne hapla TaxID=6305 RepID=A0A1I8B8J0_MELHA